MKLSLSNMIAVCVCSFAIATAVDDTLLGTTSTVDSSGGVAPVVTFTDNAMENISTNNYSTTVQKPNLLASNSSNVDAFIKMLEAKLGRVPYMQSVILPATIGVLFAAFTLMLLCCIRLCVRAHLRKRRRRKIRNLADELKSDKGMLVEDSTDEEF